MESLIDPYYSLSKDVNTAKSMEDKIDKQGVVSGSTPEIELPISDEDLIKVTTNYKSQWDKSSVKTEWLKAAEENMNYWLGKHYGRSDKEEKRAEVDNLIFESLESFLPQATRRNPEPMVSIVGADDQQESQDPQAQQKKVLDEAFVKRVKNKLAFLADELTIRLKIKKAARHWAILMLGVLKVGWSVDNDEIAIKVINPKKMILDPESFVDEDGYHGRFTGEYRKMEAGILEVLAPKKKKEIEEELSKNDDGSYDMATELQFIEWNTPEYLCWTLNKHVLLKAKNPNWNYNSEKQGTQTDEFGAQTPQTTPVKGINHFKTPQIPYMFLSIFNVGDQPMDKTSLIGQNLANQDSLNKRNKQIDHNADNQNGGIVVSLERSGLTKEQAKGVTEAIKRGGTIMIPSGSPAEAIQRFPNNPLPAEIFNNQQVMRDRMRDIFGTRGTTPAGIANEDTVRGKIMVRTMDTDRIGGGITEYLEQLADMAYNHCVQMMYVHYPEVQQLFATGYVPPQLDVTVKEGSLLPKDSTTLANQAIELAGEGKMSLIDLYKRLEYPNPEELAANVWLEANSPELLFKDNPMVQQAIQMKQQAAQGAGQRPPSQSISYRDVPPEAQAQMLGEVGIKIHPVQAFQHEKIKSMRSKMGNGVPPQASDTPGPEPVPINMGQLQPQ